MTDFDPGPLADVEVVPDGDRWTLVFARDLRHAPGAVWRALTDPARQREWAPFTADRDLGTTGPAVLTMTDDDPQDLPCEVRVADAPHVLVHTWGDDLLRWEVGDTRLALRHTVDDRDGVPMYAAGWHLCLAVLDRLLDGAPVGPIVGKKAMDYGWADLRDRYAERIG